MSYTIKDVAKYANVSVGTASKYINGIFVKEKNSTRIQNAIDALNFTPNALARSLRENKTKTIGIVIRNLIDIFSGVIASDIEKQMTNNGYGVLISNYGISGNEAEAIELLLRKHVDGIIVFPSGEVKDYGKINKENIPIVTIDEYVDKSCDSVTMNNYAASCLAAKYILKNGHKKIAIITGEISKNVFLERYMGIKETLLSAGLKENEDFTFYDAIDSKSSYKITDEILNGKFPPTIIYTTSYYFTVGALMAISEKRLSIPDQISFIGFDYNFMFDIFEHDLTSINQNHEEIASAATNILLKRLSGDYKNFPEKNILNVDFCEGSTVLKI